MALELKSSEITKLSDGGHGTSRNDPTKSLSAAEEHELLWGKFLNHFLKRHKRKLYLRITLTST